MCPLLLQSEFPLVLGNLWMNEGSVPMHIHSSLRIVSHSGFRITSWCVLIIHAEIRQCWIPALPAPTACSLVTIGSHLLSFGQLQRLLGWAIRRSNPGRDKILFSKSFQTRCEPHSFSYSVGIGVLLLAWSDWGVKVTILHHQRTRLRTGGAIYRPYLRFFMPWTRSMC